MIQLPIYFHTEETHAIKSQSLDLGIPFDVDDADYDIRPVAFFSVDYVFPSKNESGEIHGTMIGSGGDEFRSPLKFEEVVEIVSKEI